MSKRIKLIIYISFFLSGIAGLIYEVLWAKYLSLIFGNTAYAHSLVLATFMGGLAIGSYTLGKLADRVKNRLTLFAWIEIGIALYCIFTHTLFISSKNIYIGMAQTLALTPSLILLIKFIIGAVIILPPTILMGGTLPILSKFLIHSFAVRGRTVARLYYANSFGAVAGTILAGFFLIYHFGLAFSTTIAAVINLTVGCIALILKGFTTEDRSAVLSRENDLEEREKIGGEQPPYSKKIIVVALLGIFFSGCAAMLYEVVWIRLLSTILGGSTYSFSLMLAAFISGITIGAFLISKFMPRERLTFFVFGLCEIGIGLSLIFSLPFYEKLPFFFSRLSAIFTRTPNTFALYTTVKFFISFLIMLPPTVFMGMTLPLVSKIASTGLKGLGKKVGGVFALNTTGNIIGALVTGLLLISLLGLRQTLELGIIINIAVGIIVIFTDATLIRSKKLSLAFVCCLLFIGYKVVIPDWNRAAFTAEIFRNRTRTKDYQEYKNAISKKDIVFYKDGVDTTVAVAKNSEKIVLYVNGKADASSAGDLPTQVLSAQLPLILKPDSKDVLVVGLGSGITCGSALLHPIETLDLIEISSAVVEANKYFTPYNYSALSDERLHLYIEDAKTYLQRTEKKYDAIISEPSNPWMSGIGSLFSTEYFNDCLQRLKPGGVMVQWIQAYEIDDRTFEMVLRTFCSVFSEVQIWTTGVADILLLGSNTAFETDFEASSEVIAQKNIQDDLQRIKLTGLYTLLNLQLSSDSHLRKAIGNVGLVNSDYFPKLSYQAPLALYTSSMPVGMLKKLDTRKIPLKRSGLLVGAYLKDHELDDSDFKNLYSFLTHKSFLGTGIIIPLVERWHRSYPEDQEAMLAYAHFNQRNLKESIDLMEKIIFEMDQHQYIKEYTVLLYKKCKIFSSHFFPDIYSEVVHEMGACVSLSGDQKGWVYMVLGNIFKDMKDPQRALASYLQAEQIFEDQERDQLQNARYLAVLEKIGLIHLENEQLAKALEYATKMLNLDQNNRQAHLLISAIEAIAAL